jgi:large subunit ribosomal protein L7/L12
MRKAASFYAKCGTQFISSKLVSGRATSMICRNSIISSPPPSSHMTQQVRHFDENAWAAQRLLKMGEKLDKAPGSALEFFSSVEEFKDTTKYPEKVQKIAMEVMKMNIIEAHQMLELIQQRMGITDEELFGNFASQFGVISHTAEKLFESGAIGGPGKSAAVGGAAVGAAPVEEKKAEKTAFGLKLLDVPATAKIKIIKEVRTITGLGLKEAKDLVEKSPTTIKEGMKKEEAEAFLKLLTEAGGKAELL